MPFEQISEEDNNIGSLRPNLGDATCQPPRAKQRTEMKVRQGDQDGAVSFCGKAREMHLIIPYDRCT